MRILGYIDNAPCKTTIFKSGNKFIIKFETNLYEQSIKLREGDAISSMADVKKYVDAELMVSIMEQFADIHKLANEAHARLSGEADDDEFDEII